MLALVVAAARGDGVAFDRLTLESIAACGPVAQVTRFEIKIERFAVRTHGQHAFGRLGGERNRRIEQSETKKKAAHEKPGGRYDAEGEMRSILAVKRPLSTT